VPRKLSHTQKDMFCRCPKQHWFRYIMGVKQRPAAAPMVGNKGHETIAAHYKREIEEPESGMSVEEFKDDWETRFNKEKDTENMDWGDVTPGEYKDRFLGTETRPGIMPDIRTRHVPLLIPHHVEHQFTLPIPGTEDQVTGYIDFHGTDVKSGKLWIRDFKFKRKNFFLAKNGVTPKEVEFDDQLTLYDLAAREIWGKIDGVSMDVFIFGLKERNRLDPYPMKRTQKDRKRIMLEFKEMSQRLDYYGDDPVNFPFCRRESSYPFPCSEQWCGYWKMCPRGGGDYEVK